MIRPLTRAALRLHHDQRGQGLVFAAMSFLLVVMAAGMVYNVGQVCMTRIQVQTAADSAALSAAMIEADCMSSIAWINNGMAQIYHSLLRQMADITTFAVLAEFEDPKSHFRPTSTNPNPDKKKLEGYPCPLDVLWGPDSPYLPEAQAAPPPGFACWKLGRWENDPNPDSLISRAKVVFPEAKRWLMELSNIEQAIALAGPVLIEDEIDRIAGEAGASCKSVFWGSRWYPLDSMRVDMTIERLTAEDGWNVEIWQSGEVTRRIEVRHPTDSVWTIRSVAGADLDETVHIERMNDEGTEWVITRTPQGTTVTCQKVGSGDEGFWVISTEGPGQAPHEIAAKPNKSLGPGAYDLIVDGKVVDTYRRNPTTHDLEVYRDGHWVSLTEYEHNGVRVQVEDWVRIDNGLSVYLGNPPVVNAHGTYFTLRTPIHFTHHVGPVLLRVTDHFAVGIARPDGEVLTAEDADGRWRKHYDQQGDYWWQHRLTPDPEFPDTKWEYNYERLGSLLNWESNRYRLGLWQAVRWNFDSDYAGWGDFKTAVASGDLPDWMYWMGVAPDGQSKTAGMTFEARSPKDRPWETGYEPPRTEYYQMRPCWHCDGTGEITRQVEDPPGSGQYHEETVTCPVCHGYKWGRDTTQVCVRPEDTAYRNQGADRWKNFLKLRLAEDNSYGVPGKVREPLVLTEEFFKYGMNVAVWANPWPGMDVGTQREDPHGSTLMPILISPFADSNEEDDTPRMPDWGCLAVASARAGFYDPDLADSGLPDKDGYIWKLKGPEHVDRHPGDPEPEDNSDRTKWLEGELSPGNLYVTRWAARLVSTKTNIDADDLELEDMDIEGRTADSAVGWLYQLFASGRSFHISKLVRENSLKQVPALNAMRRRDGRRLQFGNEQGDTSDVKFEDTVYH